MTRYYYYVVAGRQCDQTTQIFKVAVGTNKQSQRDYAFLLANAQQHGHYFEIVSRESDEFIRRLRLSLAEYDVQLEWLSCRDLSGLLRSVSTSPLQPSARLSLSTIVFPQISPAGRLLLLSGQRKNLSIMTEEQKVAIGANLTFIVLASLYIFITVFH